MLLLPRSLNERALGTRIKESQLHGLKRARRKELSYRNLERGVRLKADKIRQKIPEKFYCMQSRNVHDFLTESVVYKEKQLDAISARQIEIYLIL